MLIAAGPGDGSQTLLRDTHEVVLRRRGTNGVNGHAKVAIGTVLEAYGERQTRCQLTVQLRLSGAGTNGTDGDAVGKELGRDGIEHLASDGHAAGGEVDEHLARNTETLVDLEGLVNIGVIDQTLPADSRAGLLEVGAHNDAQVVGELFGQLLQPPSVLKSGGGVMDGAGADNDKKTVVLASDDLSSFAASLDNGLYGIVGKGDLRGQEGGGDQRILPEDCSSGQLNPVSRTRGSSSGRDGHRYDAFV